jgi:hypothetical protein
MTAPDATTDRFAADEKAARRRRIVLIALAVDFVAMVGVAAWWFWGR